jgi:hypothetical protein
MKNNRKNRKLIQIRQKNALRKFRLHWKTVMKPIFKSLNSPLYPYTFKDIMEIQIPNAMDIPKDRNYHVFDLETIKKAFVDVKDIPVHFPGQIQPIICGIDVGVVGSHAVIAVYKHKDGLIEVVDYKPNNNSTIKFQGATEEFAKIYEKLKDISRDKNIVGYSIIDDFDDDQVKGEEVE